MVSKAAVALATVSSASLSAPYTRHIGVRCRDGAGGVTVGNTSTPLENVTVAECQELCEGADDCTAFGHGGSKAQCWLLAEFSLPDCDRQYHGWDMYTREFFDTSALLQQQLDAVVAYYKAIYPDLTMSFAWKDNDRELTVASGVSRAATPEDTFLYGSGTKPLTATAVLRLVDAGLLGADEPVVTYLDPYLRSHNRPTLAEYFGEAVKNATVVDLVRMSSGIRDFEDDYSFDVWVLGNGSRFWDYPYDAMNFAVSDTNTQGGPPLYFEPGNGTAYSSTGYVIAGLLLAAVLQPQQDWYDFDLGSAISPDRSQYSSMRFPPLGNGSQKLSNYLTVPGASIADTWPTTTIYDQDPTILGFTCGNMVASPRDVARFFHDLLGQQTLVSNASRAIMTDFRTATTGWSAGHLQYGAGLMIKEYGHVTDKVVVHGHEGDTYGFISAQGFIPELGGAFSLATNVDNSAPMKHAACYLLQQARATLGDSGSSSSLACTLPTLTTTTTTTTSTFTTTTSVMESVLADMLV